MSEANVAGCRSIDDAALVAAWLLNGGVAPQSASPSWRYAFVECYDTLAWGVLGSEGWRFSSDACRDVRRPRLDTMLEARIFDPKSEALMWRNGERIVGRILSEVEVKDADLEPATRCLRFACRDDGPTELGDADFVEYRTTSGRSVIAPRGSGLRVCDHFLQDAVTGLVRVAATRFVEVIPWKQ